MRQLGGRLHRGGRWIDGSVAQESSRHGPVLDLLDDVGHPARTGAHLLAITPLRDAGIGGLTTDPGRVEQAAHAGYAAVTAALARAMTAPPPD